MKTQRRILSMALVLACSLSATWAKDYLVPLQDVAKILKIAEPGDLIEIESGTYKDLQLKWKAYGTEKKNIKIKAQTPGQVFVEGASSLRFAGEWLEISGLYFRNGTPASGAVIEYRYNDDHATNCRLTNCVVDGYNPSSRDKSYSYVLMYGRNNRFDHSTLTNKLNLGVTLIVMIDEERSQKNFHRIDHNVFGFRPVYGSNGAETLRVGTSQQAYESSNTIIEDNVFERCNGEVEVVSIKSSDNIIRRNYFYECEGVLALRHGDRNEVRENNFVGGNKRNTGGVRVINAGHTIEDNVFVDLAGTRFFSALALMNAVPNSLPNRYCLVEDVVVKNNQFSNCTNIEIGTGNDLERTLAPERVCFEDNTIVNKNIDEPYKSLGDVKGVAFKDNIVDLFEDIDIAGFKNSDKIEIRKIPSLNEARSDKGASYYEYPIESVLKDDAVYTVSVKDDLVAIVKDALPGSTIVLSDAGGDYQLSSAIVVDKPLTIRADTKKARPIVRFVGEKTDNMITIDNNGELHISGIAFCGRLEPGKDLAKAGIATADNMITHYNLNVDNCEFYDFYEGGFYSIKGGKNTFADKIEVRNTIFRDLSGDAIHFASERDDKGRYNADDMIIENCSFYRILGIPVNIYRGGSDESTAGPYVAIRNCTFEDSCNKERGSVLRLIGPQVLEVSRCSFANSGRGGCAIRLDEATWEDVRISDCNLYVSGPILSMTNKVIKGEIFDIKPTYTNQSSYDFTSEKGSSLDSLGIGKLADL